MAKRRTPAKTKSIPASSKDAAQSLLRAAGLSECVLAHFDSLIDLYRDRVHGEQRPSPSAQRLTARSGARRVWKTVELLERDDIGEAILISAALNTRFGARLSSNIDANIRAAVATLRSAAHLLDLSADNAFRAPRGEREKASSKWLEAQATRALREAGIRKCRLLARDWSDRVREDQAAREADERRILRAEKRSRR